MAEPEKRFYIGLTSSGTANIPSGVNNAVFARFLASYNNNKTSTAHCLFLLVDIAASKFDVWVGGFWSGYTSSIAWHKLSTI